MADISENYIKQIELVQKNESTGNNESTFINIGSPHLKRIKCSDLKNLKDNGKLEEGTWYRITDYGSGGETPDFYGHAFDILVLAVSNNALSEECRATYHVVDNIPDTSYFGDDIHAWRIWYSIDNTDTYGKIYRMIDKWGNDCPYDFKNVKVNEGYTFLTPGGEDASLSSLLCRNNIILSDSKSITLKGEMEIKNNIIGRKCSNILLTNSNNVTILDNCKGIECNKCYEVKIGTNCNNLTFYGDYENSFKHIYVDADTKNVIIESRGPKVVHDIYIHHSVSGEIIDYDKDVNCIQHYEKNQNGVICNWHV